MARRYLMDRYGELTGRYAELPDEGRAHDGFRYSSEAKRIYPRYNVVRAMLEEVERLDPDRLPGLEPLTACLVEAAETAQSVFTTGRHGRVETDAMDAEHRLFSSAVRTWRSGVNRAVARLGYRRVLSQTESDDWRRPLASRWDVRNLSWHPMIVDQVPDRVLVLRAEAMWDGPGARLMREALHDMGRNRVVELREFGAEYVLDVDLLEPWYNGAEGMWTDEHLDWLAFASHESTIAFGGVLAELLADMWPHLDEWRWTGM
jgi:hypothetical protein